MKWDCRSAGEKNPILSKKGFTLIELLIVIIIIGLLLSISTPIASKVMEKAELVTAKAKARNVYQAYMMARIDAEGGRSFDEAFNEYIGDIDRERFTLYSDGSVEWKDKNGNVIAKFP